MPLSARALTLLETVKEDLGITDATNDTLLERYINEASDFILGEIDRKFIRLTFTSERYEGHNSTDLYLREYPIQSIEKIELLDVELVEADEDYELTDRDKEAGRVYRELGWDAQNRQFGPLTNTPYGERIRNIKVDYTSGFCTPHQDTGLSLCTRDMPYDIEGLIINMVNIAFGKFCTGTKGQSSYKAGSRTISWRDCLNQCEKDILLRYERKDV